MEKIAKQEESSGAPPTTSGGNADGVDAKLEFLGRVLRACASVGINNLVEIVKKCFTLLFNPQRYNL